MLDPVLLLLALLGTADAAARNERLATAPALAAKIDALVEHHWRENEVKPSPPADDATFLRRLTLDHPRHT